MDDETIRNETDAVARENGLDGEPATAVPPQPDTGNNPGADDPMPAADNLPGEDESRPVPAEEDPADGA